MATFDAHGNLAYSTVATAPSPATSGTSLVVASGDGATFPAASFNALVWPAGARPTKTNSEIVRVTNISTDTFTITRAQESSTARSIIIGDQIANTATAKTFTDIQSLFPAGAVVGDTDTQTISNKTLDNTNTLNLVGGNFTLQKSGDATAQAQFSMASIGSGTFRTLTIPNVSGTILQSSTAVTVAQGGTGRATGTTANGLIAVGSTATGIQQTISPGTSGQILKSNGASSLATFQTGAPADVALGNVDNTADSAKSVASAATLTTSRNIDGQAFNGSADITVIAPGTHAATSKTTPVDADELPLVDSAASNVLKKLTWANLKATIKAYYDAVASTLTNKTFDTAGAGNSLSINGVAATDNTGTGKVVRDGSPSISTPTIIGNLAVSAGYTYDLGSSGVPWNNIWAGFSVNIQNAGVNTEIVAGANGVNQILTLPLGTDTIVSRNSTDNLTNKTFDSTSPTAFFAPGFMLPYAARVAPTGWLLCDGSAISRTTYATLFASITPSLGTFTVTIASPAVVTKTSHGLLTGDQVYLTNSGGALPTGLSQNTLYYVIKIDANTFNLATTRANSVAATKINTSGTQSGTHTLWDCPYGLGDGSTTFNIPDSRGRILAGADGMGGTAASRLTLAQSQGSYGQLGATGGEQGHTIITAEMAAHTHTQDSHNHTQDSHNHTQDSHSHNSNTNSTAGGTPVRYGGSAGASQTTIATGGTVATNQATTATNQATTATNQNTGGDGAHNNVQPVLVVSHIIKT